MMTFEESKKAILAIYESINKGDIFKENSEEHNQVLEVCKLARITFKECTCKFMDRLTDTVTELMVFFKNNTEFKSCQYEMRRGVSFIVDGFAYTNTNLTDDIAEKLIAEREGADKYITKVMNEAEEITDEVSTEAETEDEVSAEAVETASEVAPASKKTKKTKK